MSRYIHPLDYPVIIDIECFDSLKLAEIKKELPTRYSTYINNEIKLDRAPNNVLFTYNNEIVGYANYYMKYGRKPKPKDRKELYPEFCHVIYVLIKGGTKKEWYFLRKSTPANAEYVYTCDVMKLGFIINVIKKVFSNRQI